MLLLENKPSIATSYRSIHVLLWQAFINIPLQLATTCNVSHLMTWFCMYMYVILLNTNLRVITQICKDYKDCDIIYVSTGSNYIRHSSLCCNYLFFLPLNCQYMKCTQCNGQPNCVHHIQSCTTHLLVYLFTVYIYI